MAICRFPAMPIPPFDGILGCLPPHLGDPRESAQISPYAATMKDVVERFATSPERVEILNGFLKLRAVLRGLGMCGFHWIDGSFLEDIELLQRRAPGDIDVVTFIRTHSSEEALQLLNSVEAFDRQIVKKKFKVDHFPVSLKMEPERLVAHACYWYQLFSHQREKGWKGMLRVDLNPSSDSDAHALLAGKP
jgi:hypothetical protein